MPPKRLVALPALGLAIVLFIFAYQIRTRLNRPDVPLPVSTILEHLAPGLSIGKTLREDRAHLAASRWRSGVGYVGTARGGLFARALLLPSFDDRKASKPNDGARVEVVELTTDNNGDMTGIMPDIAIAFRSVPRTGCIARIDGRHDQVSYWVTRRDLGGVALIAGWGGDSVVPSVVHPWSMVAWAGEFKGSETLTAPFDPHPCSGATAAVTPPAIRASIAAREQTQTAFVDSLRAAVDEKVAAAQAEIANPDTPTPCVAPTPTGRVTQYLLYGFSVDLPDEFYIADRERQEAAAKQGGVAHYEWTASDGSTVSIDAVDASRGHRGTLGRITGECDVQVSGHDVHVDLGNASVYDARLTVGATYKSDPQLALGFFGLARSEARQRELLRAAYSIQLYERWGKREGER